METSVIGSTFKVNINIDGLGDKKFLSDDEVGITAKFFTRHPNNAGYSAYVVHKANMQPAYEGDCNDYVCVVDTTNIGCGRLICEVAVSYRDYESNQSIVEIPIIETDIVLVREQQ